MQKDGVWGPESTCPTCGAAVQRLVSNRYPGGFRTFAAGTLNRHLCIVPPLDSGTMPEPIEETRTPAERPLSVLPYVKRLGFPGRSANGAIEL